MAYIIAKSSSSNVYPEHCKLNNFQREIVLTGKIEDSGRDINDVAKTAATEPKELMGLLNVCQGCVYLSGDQCKGV